MFARRMFVLWTLGLAALVAWPAVAQQPAPAAPDVPPREGKRETIELFNGRDLAGWTGHEKHWSARDGMIIGRNTEPIAVSTYLLTDRKFSDFRLTFEFRLAQSEMHSGIAMWGRLAPEQGDPYTYAGHLVMFPSNYGFYDLYGRKGIHNNARIAKPLGRQHDWNQMEILAQGNRIRFVLNGTLVSDWREPEPARIHEAPIGLQLHSNQEPQEVQFRKLVLETFPEDKLTTAAAPAGNVEANARPLLYVGTYTRQGDSQGIYVADFDPATGKLGPPRLVAQARDPSFLAIHPSRRLLFAVQELNEFEQKPSGAIASYQIQPATGALTELDLQSTLGGSPCHVTVDQSGDCVLVANYGGGSVAAFRLDSEGKLASPAAFVQHHGSSVDPRRQEGPHAHSFRTDPAGKFAIAADLGLDQLLVYRLNAKDGSLQPNNPPYAKTPEGAGPRQFTFHPNGRWLYVVNEMASSVSHFDYDREHGVLKLNETVSPLPANFQGQSSGAEIQMHPSGRFVYASNRGHNSITSFSIDPASGQLTPTGHATNDIDTPRHFMITPDGKFAIVASQGNHRVSVFRVNPQTGLLAPTEHSMEVPAPVCVQLTH